MYYIDIYFALNWFGCSGERLGGLKSSRELFCRKYKFLARKIRTALTASKDKSVNKCTGVDNLEVKVLQSRVGRHSQSMQGLVQC